MSLRKRPAPNATVTVWLEWARPKAPSMRLGMLNPGQRANCQRCLPTASPRSLDRKDGRLRPANRTRHDIRKASREHLSMRPATVDRHKPRSIREVPAPMPDHGQTLRALDHTSNAVQMARWPRGKAKATAMKSASLTVRYPALAPHPCQKPPLPGSKPTALSGPEPEPANATNKRCPAGQQPATEPGPTPARRPAGIERAGEQ